ncbi:PAS/PAC sensor hybrid histidine kinase [Granulicella rosea]|uniref:histidine kinase n=1 Tax=Granulicella rosea TaxID=474952 RepID=A0A239KV23_9BACT|nr:hybrid sensor histidine kinase/response regulator [Granulicella rosea]SNT21349.1 PAS/PAC sensor hybrid histidine kinase [Granulicella rosea]
MSAEVTGRALRVLLVEDNADDAFLLERHLRKQGFAPVMVRVETLAEMVQALDPANLPDVVLADYNLPKFSGPAALQMLKSAGYDVPFIMMSGAVSEETAVESMRAGAHDYVTKQNLARLVPALERELREAAARRDRLEAELALRASEARFHRLVEAMPLGLLIGDAQGRIVYANVALEQLLGYESGALPALGIPLGALCPALGMMSGFVTSPTDTFEAICTRSDGQPVEVLIGVAPLNPGAEAEERQIAAFIADLTLQKKSEEVLRRTEKLAVAGRLAASIAHEINNPLEAVTNCLYLVGATDLPDEARQFLELAQNELNRVAQITVQTLRFYRGSTRSSLTNVHDLLETVLTLLDSRLRRQHVEIERRLGGDPEIVAQDGEIRQVLANLIGNAIDALPNGGRILLRTAAGCDWSPESPGRPGIRITVADTGIGMSPETLGRIFEPFFSTKGITGTGLGLWVSHEIVEKHHGSLRVRSREATADRPGGTVFTLFLPAASEQRRSNL